MSAVMSLDSSIRAEMLQELLAERDLELLEANRLLRQFRELYAGSVAGQVGLMREKRAPEDELVAAHELVAALEDELGTAGGQLYAARQRIAQLETPHTTVKAALEASAVALERHLSEVVVEGVSK